MSITASLKDTYKHHECHATDTKIQARIHTKMILTHKCYHCARKILIYLPWHGATQLKNSKNETEHVVHQIDSLLQWMKMQLI